MLRSPSNVVLSFLVQLFYYVAQLAFWYGIRSAEEASGEIAVKNGAVSQNFIGTESLMGFLVTLGLVDNLYLLFFGPGSIVASAKIMNGDVDAHLLQPRHPLRDFIFCYPNLSYIPCAAVSIIIACVYFIHVKPELFLCASYLVCVFLGIFVLNAISFLFRLTVFWTRSIVQIRNANPSFKIMVRPYDSFQGPVKFVLMTLFPALFITGVPSKILVGELSILWFLGSLVAGSSLWLSVYLMWRLGMRSYGKVVT